MNKNYGRAGAGVRQYNKSQLPRVKWTPQLHHRFVQAVDDLGGKYKATPKRILQIMSVKGLNISHIKSHLQMYRSLKDSNNRDMVVPVRHRHLRLRRSASVNAGLFSDLSLSKRVVGYEHKDWESQEGNFKQHNFSKESNHSLLQMEEAANLFERRQDKYACLLGKSLKEEDNGGLGQVCELSLSFNRGSATIQKSEEEKGYFRPLINEFSRPTFIRTSKFSSNYINLDLTISTTFSN